MFTAVFLSLLNLSRAQKELSIKPLQFRIKADDEIYWSFLDNRIPYEKIPPRYPLGDAVDMIEQI